VVPARERLDADRLLAAGLELELVMHLELAAHERGAKVALERPASLQPAVHLRLEKAERIAALLLGAVERDVGELEKAARLLGIAWRERHADAGSDDDLVTIELEWLNERCQQSGTQRLGLTWPLNAHLDQRELVAPEPGDRVHLAHARLEPPGTQLDQPVAGGVAEGVVDALETVEVDDEDSGHAVAAAQAGQRLLEALAQQLAVRQLRHRVMQGEVVSALLGRNLRRDVACGATIAVKASKTVQSGLAGETQDAAAVGAVLHRA
jgi:hypothetical protein